MKKILLTTLGLISLVSANDAATLFNNKCATCHQVQVQDKNTLVAPPINKVMMHVKKAFPKKADAIAFMKDYVINPDPKKTICPSIDIFGVMPSQKGALNEKELDAVVNYAYENFPKGTMQHKGMMGHKMGHGMGMHRGMGFMRMDSNGDGFISKDEFNAFRAKKEGIDVSKIKYDYFFKKLDKNGDGKLSKEEFMQFVQMMRG